MVSKMESFKSILDSEVAYDLLVTKISEAAREKIEQDAQRTRTRVAILSTAGLTVFVAAFTGLASLALQQAERSIIQSAQEQLTESVAIQTAAAMNSIQTQVSQQVAAAVDEEANEAKGAWRRLTLVSQADRLTNNTSFTPQELDDAINLLKEAGNDKRFRDSPEFSTSLGRIVSAIAAIEDSRYLKRIQRDFEEDMLRIPAVTATMAEVTGRTVIASGFVLDTSGGYETTPEWIALRDEYRKWSIPARDNNFAEISTVYDFVISCIEGRNHLVRAAYLAKGDDLSDSDFDFALGYARALSSQSWKGAGAADNETLRAQSRANSCATGIDPSGLSTRAALMLDALRAQ